MREIIDKSEKESVVSLKVKLDEHIKQCPKEKIEEISEQVYKNATSLTFLKTFLIPIISIGNLVALGILISITMNLSEKLDKFTQTYYKDKSLVLEKSISDIKQRSKFFRQCEDNTQKIKDINSNIDKIADRVNKLESKVLLLNSKQ